MNAPQPQLLRHTHTRVPLDRNHHQNKQHNMCAALCHCQTTHNASSGLTKGCITSHCNCEAKGHHCGNCFATPSHRQCNRLQVFRLQGMVLALQKPKQGKSTRNTYYPRGGGNSPRKTKTNHLRCNRNNAMHKFVEHAYNTATITSATLSQPSCNSTFHPRGAGNNADRSCRIDTQAALPKSHIT